MRLFLPAAVKLNSVISTIFSLKLACHAPSRFLFTHYHTDSPSEILQATSLPPAIYDCCQHCQKKFKIRNLAYSEQRSLRDSWARISNPGSEEASRVLRADLPQNEQLVLRDPRTG
jgi:hypothetical protein